MLSHPDMPYSITPAASSGLSLNIFTSKKPSSGITKNCRDVPRTIYLGLSITSLMSKSISVIPIQNIITISAGLIKTVNLESSEGKQYE